MSSSQRIFIVTGLSGAGKSTALKILEDFGCEVIDNIPISLCAPLIEQKRTSLALGIDVRTRDFDAHTFAQTIDELKNSFALEILFFEASAETIQRRYRETRRLHPLGTDTKLLDLIHTEQTLLEPVRHKARFIVDTTAMSPPETRSHLVQMLGLTGKAMIIFVLSFSFRQGVPQHADFVFDVRFLKNPYYNQSTRLLTGQNAQTQEYLSMSPEYQKFKNALEPLFLEAILPPLAKEGRGSLVIAFGCTGGRHRSVCMADIFTRTLQEHGYVAQASHRDLM